MGGRGSVCLPVHACGYGSLAASERARSRMLAAWVLGGYGRAKQTGFESLSSRHVLVQSLTHTWSVRGTRLSPSQTVPVPSLGRARSLCAMYHVCVCLPLFQ